VVNGPAGRSDHAPLFSSPNSAAKHAGESNLGRHNQSTEPSRETNAAVVESLSSA